MWVKYHFNICSVGWEAHSLSSRVPLVTFEITCSLSRQAVCEEHQQTRGLQVLEDFALRLLQPTRELKNTNIKRAACTRAYTHTKYLLFKILIRLEPCDERKNRRERPITAANFLRTLIVRDS